MIVQMTHENICDINMVNDPFEIIGKITPKYENNMWTLQIVLMDKVDI